MSCERCEKLEQNIKNLQSDITEMFVYAFRTGFKLGGENAIKSIQQSVDSSLNTSLFSFFAKQHMKEYFTDVNPPEKI